MKTATIIVRGLLGLAFIFFGVNAFHQFIHPPKPLTGNVLEFTNLMARTGYMKYVGAFEIAGGVFLLINRTVPLGLVFLGPIIVNILIFHLTMNRHDIAPGLVVGALWLFLFWYNRSAFAGIFRGSRA